MTISKEAQLEIKKYLDRFYNEIYNVRLRIKIHSEIGDLSQHEAIKTNQYLAFVQRHENVCSAVLRMFAIFDENRTHLFKKFCGYLKSQNIYTITDTDLASWLKIIKPYEKFRHEKIAHASIDDNVAPPVMYENFLQTLSEFEKKLQQIHKEFITDPTVVNGTWVSSEPDSNNNILIDLKKLLFATIQT